MTVEVISKPLLLESESKIVSVSRVLKLLPFSFEMTSCPGGSDSQFHLKNCIIELHCDDQLRFSVHQFLYQRVMQSDTELSLAVKSRAKQLGFSLCGIAPAARPDTFPALQDWIRKDQHGEMAYMERREAAYEHPESVLKSARSLIVVAASYAPGTQVSIDNSGSDRREGRVAAYALGQHDYHDVLREKLKLVADLLHQERPDCRTRVIVDTAPVLERDFGRKAGLGWFGKNTMLINKQVGSFFFLAVLLTDVTLPADPMHESSHCGTCTRCLEVCPTEAFEDAYVLDARKCISYLTIELRGQPIPRELREGMGEWLFGCDLCQDVCPWNRKPAPPVIDALSPVDRPLEASRLLMMSEREFAETFKGTPFMRPGRVGMARNAAIVLGNTSNPCWTDALIQGMRDESSIVRGACVWALGKLHKSAAQKLFDIHLHAETAPEVLEEIEICRHSW